jgi:hypothetical protein
MNMFTDLTGGSVTADIAPVTLSRRKVWDVDQVFRCPVVGMCLSVKEQRLLCRKVGADVHQKSDFAVHEMIVATMNGENPLSRKLESLLSKKYEVSCQHYLVMPEEEFLRHWREHLDRGGYDGLLWAAAVRPLTNAALVEIFGTLHMTMHEHAKAYGPLKADAAANEARYYRLRVRARDVEKENKVLTSENERLRQALERLQSRVAKAPDPDSKEKIVAQNPVEGDSGPSSGAGRHDLARRVQELEHELAGHVQDMKDLHELLHEAEKDRDRIQEEFSAHLAMDAAMRKACAGVDCSGGECSPQCPSYSLCEKRVLIVGGIERMEKSYRKFIEERGGIFEYHAGHMKSGGKALESSVQRADLVLCPVNCNSHGACLKVKSLGKKYKKPVHMLNNFSLSSLARTMDQLHNSN